MKKFLFVLLFISVVVSAGSNKEILKKIEKKASNDDKVHFVVFDVDYVLFDLSSRFRYLFEKYLKRHNVKALKEYLKEKDFSYLKLKDVLSDIDKLNLSDKTAERIKKYLNENFHSPEASKKDSVTKALNIVNSLYKKGFFIVYLSKSDNSYLSVMIEKLQKAGYPIGYARTIIIMNVKKDNIAENLYNFALLGKINAFFSSDIEFVNELKPYLKKKLYYLGNEEFSSDYFTVLKNF